MTVDAALVAEKIQAALAQGDQCMGVVAEKPMAEWTAIFNQAAQTLNIPLITLEPLKSLGRDDFRQHLTNHALAFSKAAAGPVIILVDASGNDKMRDQKLQMGTADYIQGLCERFPKAIYVQAVQGISIGDPPIGINSMQPRPPGAPA